MSSTCPTSFSQDSPGPIQSCLNIPVIVSLTGEDIFLEKLPEPHATEARETNCSVALARSTPSSRHESATSLVAWLTTCAVPASEDIHVVPPGIKLAGHAADCEPQAHGPTPRDDLRIGYFSRICHDKGLHVLADALEDPHRRKAPIDRKFTLHAAGYLAPEDQGLSARRRSAGSNPSRASVDASTTQAPPTDRARSTFLQSVDMVCLPSVFPESKGIAALEAWANAKPVVTPNAGAFPELVNDTDGGMLFEQGDAESLAQSIRELAEAPNRAEEMGLRGMEAVRTRYHDTLMAQRTVAVYDSVLGKARNSPKEAP